MRSFIEKFRQTNVGRELFWKSDQLRYSSTREARLRAAKGETEQLITPLVTVARSQPGSPEAKMLVLVGANVTSHVVSEVCDPDTQFYLHGVLGAVQDWATGTTDLEAVKQTRKAFLGSDIYSNYFNLNNNPHTTEATKRMAGATSFVDEVLFGAIALDAQGSAELDIADKRGTTVFENKTFITGSDEDTIYAAHGVLPAADAGIYSIAQMSLASYKATLSLEYSHLAANGVAAIPRYMAAVAIGRFYGIEPDPNISNPLFQERINTLIKDTVNSTQ